MLPTRRFFFSLPKCLFFLFGEKETQKFKRLACRLVFNMSMCLLGRPPHRDGAPRFVRDSVRFGWDTVLVSSAGTRFCFPGSIWQLLALSASTSLAALVALWYCQAGLPGYASPLGQILLGPAALGVLGVVLGYFLGVHCTLLRLKI